MHSALFFKMFHCIESEALSQNYNCSHCIEYNKPKSHECCIEYNKPMSDKTKYDSLFNAKLIKTKVYRKLQNIFKNISILSKIKTKDFFKTQINEQSSDSSAEYTLSVMTNFSLQR